MESCSQCRGTLAQPKGVTPHLPAAQSLYPEQNHLGLGTDRGAASNQGDFQPDTTVDVF